MVVCLQPTFAIYRGVEGLIEVLATNDALLEMAMTGNDIAKCALCFARLAGLVNDLVWCLTARCCEFCTICDGAQQRLDDMCTGMFDLGHRRFYGQTTLGVGSVKFCTMDFGGAIFSGSQRLFIAVSLCTAAVATSPITACVVRCS